MTIPTDDGRHVVARGRIRVDARRALAKLREHLLVDLHLYATEIARAAIAAKATFLDVDYDTDDVVLTFDGIPAAPTELPRLLDHVLGDGHSTDRALRGLALGVNAALGLGPAFIDIFVRVPDESRTAKVRFVPAVLASEDGVLPSVEWIVPPKGMPERAMRVHVRRRLGMQLLKRAASRAVPQEIVLLAESAYAAPLKLTVCGNDLALPARPRALLRVPFQEREIRRGVLEILETPASAHIEWLELGVMLLRKPFVTEPVLPSTPHAQIELPVRVLIDADELPTNASRSALREDAPLLLRAEQGAREALTVAIQSLIALVTRQGKPLPTVEVLDGDPKKLEEALGAMVCVVAGASRRNQPLSDRAKALLELPLLQNAVGTSIRVNDVLKYKVGEIFVHHGQEALDKELAPWLDDVIWLRGKTLERIFVDMGVQDAKALAAAAHVARERKRVLHARPPSEPRVPDEAGHIVKETFRIQEGPFQGLRGQLAIGAEGQRTGQRPTYVRIFVEGRHIDTLTIDRDKLPAAMDAAIAWDGKLRPQLSYEGVMDDGQLRLALVQLTRIALGALGAYLERSVQEKRAPEERARILPLVRAALGAWVTAPKTLGVDEFPAEPPISAYLPIWTRGTWTSANPDRLPVSLAELKTYSDRTKAICYVAPGSSGVAPDGRPVVVLTDLEKEWLAQVFPGITFVPYERGLRPAANWAPNINYFELLRAAQKPSGSWSEKLPAMTIEMREGRGAIAVAAEDTCMSLHAGIWLHTGASNRFVEPATIVLDHDAIVPKPDWAGILWSREALGNINVRNDLLEKVVQSLEGDILARNALHNFPDKPGPILRAYLIEAAARFRGKELASRIEKLPLVPILDADARPQYSTLEAVAARFPDPETIPFLRAAPLFPTFDWAPLLLEHDREVSAIFRWAGNRAKIADDELERRQGIAQSELQRRYFLAKPVLSRDELGPLADPDTHQRVWQEQPRDDGQPVTLVVAGLPRIGVELPLATAEILCEDRLVCSRPLLGLTIPVVVRVFLPSKQFVVGYADVSQEGLAQIESFVYSAVCALAADLVTRAEGEKSESFFQDRRALLLIRQLYACSVEKTSRPDLLAVDFALRSASLWWPTVQGDSRPLLQLIPGGKKLYYATTRYAFWEKPARGFSELDEPIVYLPPTTDGNLMRDILAYMGHEMVDVSSAVYALQSRRKLSDSHAGPTLSGTPVHSELRTSFASLGIDLEGEVELVGGSNSHVEVETLHGTIVPLTLTLPIGVRAIARVDEVELDGNAKKKIADKIDKAAIKFLESLADRVIEFPFFVRAGLRLAVLKSVRKGRNLSKRRRQFEVFLDVLGEYHSVNELAASGDSAYPYITVIPKHPVSRRPRPPLCLTPDEAHIMSNVLPLEDVTERLQRELLAEERRQAAQASFIGLATTQRLECLDVVPFDGDVIEGEIGILAPENADKRGIWVHKERRPLCKLSDPEGWPLLAVINDDSIPENKTFDGIKGGAAKDKLRQAVKARAEAAISKWCVLPEPYLAGKKFRSKLLDESLLVVGALWLPPSWLTAGSIEVRDSSNRFPMPRTFGAPNHPDRLDFDLPIPVCGRLFILNTGATKKPQQITAALSAWLFEETTLLVIDAVLSEQDPRAAEGYQWLMRFFGADVGDLEAVAADGRRIDASEIIATLRTKKEIWVSTTDTDVEGAFPGEMPPFILRGQGQALVDVLRARTNVIRELAARQPVVSNVKPGVVPQVAAFKQDKPAVAPTIAPVVDDVRATNEHVVEEPEQEIATSWFRNLVQRVVVFFDPPPALEPWTKELGPSLMLAIDKLGLTSTSVVTGVRYVRRGRPMVFEEASGQLVINRAHEGVRTLAAKAQHDSRARLLLIVLAVREINRVLEVVTDATERRVLLALLRGESF